MATILPLQGRFDKEIPENLGNAEYRRERELLIAMDAIIAACHLEDPAIRHFLKVAREEKAAAVAGTDKSPHLTANEHDQACVTAVTALRMALLRKRLGLSLRRFALILSHSDLYRWFCAINRFALPKIPGKSAIGHRENSIPKSLLDELEHCLGQAAQAGAAPALPAPLDFSRCYVDCACVLANIHYPVDWLLLRDATRTLMKSTALIRKAGLCRRMPHEPKGFISRMNKQCMRMTYAYRQKGAQKQRKAVFRAMKALFKTVVHHAMNHVQMLEARWQTTGLSQAQTRQIIQRIAAVTGQLETVVKNAHERIIGGRPVANADKILSLYETKVQVIVRRKAGAETEFGNTLYLAEQEEGLIIDWKLYEESAPADCKMIQDSRQRIQARHGVTLRLLAGDRGFDSQANRDNLEADAVFNALCPRDPALLARRLQETEFKTAQTRRSQTEARIAILSHCFCGSPMKQKGFERRETHLGLGILSHNLWVLARLKIAQDKEKTRQQSA